MQKQTEIVEKKLTIRDIAQIAGVAKTTVSEVVNNRRSKVSDKTFEKVRRVIERYDFTPSGAGRTLSSRRTYQIGFLVSTRATLGLCNDYFSAILSGVNAVCQKSGYLTAVSTYDLNNVANFVVPDKLRQRSVDALVIAGTTMPETIQKIKKLGIPFIVVGGIYEDPEVLCISADMVATYERVVQYLADLDHRRLAFGSMFSYSREQFSQAVVNVSARTGINLAIDNGNLTIDNEFGNGIELALKWLQSPADARFSALVSNEQICCGFLQTILNAGARCPEEVSIIASSGDSVLTKWNAIPISTIASQPASHGMTAATLLIELLENRRTFGEICNQIRELYKPFELIIRKTTGKCRKPGGNVMN